MRRLEDLAGQDLVCRKDSIWTRNAAVYADNEPVATLTFQKLLSNRALYAAATGSWTFNRTPNVSRQYTIARLDVSEASPATYEEQRPSVGGAQAVPEGSGTLITPKGTTASWNATDPLQTRGASHTKWAWQDPPTTPLVQYRALGGAKLLWAVTIEPPAAARSDLALLVGLGCYLLHLYYADRIADS